MFKYEKDNDNIVTVTMDMQGRSANVINEEFGNLWLEMINRLEEEKNDIAGVVLASAKSTFFAGADIDNLFKQTDAKLIFDMCEGLKKQLRRLETLGKPVVAALNGAALGGGLRNRKQAALGGGHHVGGRRRSAGHQQVRARHRDRHPELPRRGARIRQRVDDAVTDPVDPPDIQSVVEHRHRLRRTAHGHKRFARQTRGAGVGVQRQTQIGELLPHPRSTTGCRQCGATLLRAPTVHGPHQVDHHVRHRGRRHDRLVASGRQFHGARRPAQPRRQLGQQRLGVHLGEPRRTDPGPGTGPIAFGVDLHRSGRLLPAPPHTRRRRQERRLHRVVRETVQRIRPAEAARQFGCQGTEHLRAGARGRAVPVVGSGGAGGQREVVARGRGRPRGRLRGCHQFGQQRRVHLGGLQ